MNNEELKQLAATLNGIAEGKAWEYLYCDDWHTAKPAVRVLHTLSNHKIRLKVWSLPPPPEGREWFIAGKWTEDMLPEGYRPLLVGEHALHGDEWRAWIPDRNWKLQIQDDANPAEFYSKIFQRTKRPLPQPPPPPDPYANLKAAHAAGKVIQCKVEDWDEWDDVSPTWCCDVSCYRIKPDLIKVPLDASDIKAGDEFLTQSGLRYQWSAMDLDSLVLHHLNVTFIELMDGKYRISSIGETEWRPCYKEVEA